MDSETIGAALKRKLGPLPVWIWAMLGGVILYFLRSKGYFGGNAIDQGQTLQPRQEAATTPQAQVPLQPGESVYDPNTGAISTAPGGDASGGGATGTDPSQAIDDLAAAIAGGFTTTVKVNSVTPRQPTKTAKAAAAKKADTKAKTKARSAHAKARANAVNAYKKRTAKKKPAHTQKPGHTATAAVTKKPVRARSAASITPHTGSSARTKPARAAKATKTRTVAQHSASTTRQRPTVPLARRTAPVQHTVSSHQKPAAAHHNTPTPRPSSPPQRTTRQPPPPKPAPKGRRRK